MHETWIQLPDCPPFGRGYEGMPSKPSSMMYVPVAINGRFHINHSGQNRITPHFLQGEEMKTDHTISKPVENPSFVVLSLGAGVQSTVMALMAARGEIKPMPDYMIFADTGWEPQGVYDHLDWIEEEVNRITGKIPLFRVSSGNIRSDLLKAQNSTGQRFASIPYFLEGNGMAQRQCTKEYKVEPIIKKIRGLAGLRKGQKAPKDLKVEQWIGISMDELQRVKDHNKKYIVNRWPLLEHGMRRYDCIKWFKELYPDRVLAKSACIGCPYRDDKGWQEMKDNDPESFQDAVNVDKIIRNVSSSDKMNKAGFLHSSRKPLDEVDFDQNRDQMSLGFDNECEGMCGV